MTEVSATLKSNEGLWITYRAENGTAVRDLIAADEQSGVWADIAASDMAFRGQKVAAEVLGARSTDETATETATTTEAVAPNGRVYLPKAKFGVKVEDADGNQVPALKWATSLGAKRDRDHGNDCYTEPDFENHDELVARFA